MFTGIIGATGVLASREGRGPGARLSIAAIGESLGVPLTVGESVAVHGVCLTVETTSGDGFLCDATAETLARTTLGSIPIGARLHLERSLAVGDRLGGHMVSGHVDGKIRVRERENLGEAAKLVFEIEDGDLARFVAPKGSVAIDGVSLTVNGATDTGFDVVIIPHTLAVTTLGGLAAGKEANLEVDLLARYVGRLLECRAGTQDGAKDAVLLAKLKAAGFF
jgi:riboflavin synthase